MTNEVWTSEELEIRLYRPEPDAPARGRRLGAPLLGLLTGGGFLVMAAAVDLSAPVEVLHAGAAAVVLGLVGLGTYRS